MPRLVDAYTIRPNEIDAGDVMCFVVKALVTHCDSDGVLQYRLYRCTWQGDDVPQGSRLGSGEETVCQQLFPSLAMMGKPG